MLQTVSVISPNLSSHPCGQSWHSAPNVDISSLVRSKNEEVDHLNSQETTPKSESHTPGSLSPLKQPLVPSKRPVGPGDMNAESPAKKQSKWSADEDARIIQLRGENMKWEDISKHLPGRSAISCRLHYQNYLERRSEWDEDRKNKLARLYERFKAEMWSKIAEEMAIPWRAAEAMHWQMGENEMARRAGVTPFALTNASSAQQNGVSVPRLTRPSAPCMRTTSSSRPGSQQLPSLAELTAGLPAYTLSAYHLPCGDRPSVTSYNQGLSLSQQNLTPPSSRSRDFEYLLRRP